MANNTPLQGTDAAAHAVQALFGDNTTGDLRAYVLGNRARYALEQARRERDKNIGFSGITPEAVQLALHVSPERAAVITSQLHAGLNPNLTAEAQGTYQKNDIRTRALNAFTGTPAQDGQPAVAPDMNTGNALLAVLQQKPMILTKNEGDTILSPYATPDSQTIAPTPLGNARIAEQHALAAAANALVPERQAQTRAADALAGKRNGGGSSKAHEITSNEKQTFFTSTNRFGHKIVDQDGLVKAQTWLDHNPGKSLSDYRLYLEQQNAKKASAAAQPAPPAPPPGAPDPYGQNVPRPMTVQDYNALPSGTVYFNPTDQQYHRKP